MPEFSNQVDDEEDSNNIGTCFDWEATAAIVNFDHAFFFDFKL